MSSRVIHVVARVRTSFLCVERLHFAHPFICSWTLASTFGCCEYCCYKHGCISNWFTFSKGMWRNWERYRLELAGKVTLLFLPSCPVGWRLPQKKERLGCGGAVRGRGIQRWMPEGWGASRREGARLSYLPKGAATGGRSRRFQAGPLDRVKGRGEGPVEDGSGPWPSQGQAESGLRCSRGGSFLTTQSQTGGNRCRPGWKLNPLTISSCSSSDFCDHVSQ